MMPQYPYYYNYPEQRAIPYQPPAPAAYPARKIRYDQTDGYSKAAQVKEEQITLEGLDARADGEVSKEVQQVDDVQS